ncbi:hypothetical protein [Sorangium sp. So ce1389]|uniref:hypothetical protein n=1 Tax=Sorangium sp. So ce1389 TaxID=3133336 RepID=UPI003F63C531
MVVIAQDLVIKAVSGGYGCKLVSPWISPTMLIPISLAPKDDTSLWWTTFGPEDAWSEDKRFLQHYSAENPALAEFQGKLYCVHRGNGDSSLWWATFDPDQGWGEDHRFPNHASASGPALVDCPINFST